MLKQAEGKFAKLNGSVNVRYMKADIADMMRTIRATTTAFQLRSNKLAIAG